MFGWDESKRLNAPRIDPDHLDAKGHAP